MGGFALAGLAVRLAFWLAVVAFRVVGRTGGFAWRRPWAFMASLLVLPVLLALPEYIA